MGFTRLLLESSLKKKHLLLGLYDSMKKINRLVIISHVIHYSWQANYYAYGPYTREIDIWADLFPQVTIAAPLHQEKPPLDCLPFTRTNIDIAPQLERGGNTWHEKLFQIISLPATLWRLSISMRKADAIQVRCPGNLGLLGVILAPLFSRYRVAKYAGQWNGYPGEARSYRLQRRILQSKWWNAPVLVYGDWAGQPAHVKPFFTSIMETEQVKRAEAACSAKQIHAPLRVVFVGRLSRAKNVHVFINAIKKLRKENIPIEARVIGDGPEMPALQQQITDLQLSDTINLMGAIAFEEVLSQYEWADVLALASETEGWPKAIAEAMAFGLVCIGSNRGLIPQMLADGRGLLVEPGDEEMLASALQSIAAGKVDFLPMSQKASRWAQRYSLNGLREAIRELLIREWHLTDNDLRKLP
jgi:glycosyltransferase involved in cell wall biosynthesis